MKYLLKQCGHQELGSRRCRTDSPHRGQYLMMSHADAVLAFFPPLSSSQLNDFHIVPLIPLYLKGNRVYCRFSYHNDKFHGSTANNPRNEFRVYLSKAVQGDSYSFWEDDIIVFRPISESDPNEGLYLEHVSPRDSSYRLCKRILEENQISKQAASYAIFDGNLPFFERKVSLLPDPKGARSNIIISPADMGRVASSPKTYADLFTKVTFRDFLSVGYQNLCAVTRTSIRYESLCNVEAAHIRPKAHGGTYHPSNGILLSRDMHWAFDHGFFTLNDDYTIRLSHKPGPNIISPFENKQIFLPSEVSFRPDIESIRWHRQYVFEHFETIRNLDD